MLIFGVWCVCKAIKRTYCPEFQQELLILEQTGEDKLQSTLEIKICATVMDNSCATDLLLLSDIDRTDFGPQMLCIHFFAY